MGTVTRERPFLKANQPWEDIRTRTIMDEMRRGRLNNGKSGSKLTKDATSTTISDDIVTTVSVVLTQAETQDFNDYRPAITRANVLDGSFVVTHNSTSTSTVGFTYAVF